MSSCALGLQCQYRNHSKVWLQPGFIESIAEAKNGSVVHMASGTVHELLDTPEEIEQKALAMLNEVLAAQSPRDRTSTTENSVGQQEREEE